MIENPLTNSNKQYDHTKGLEEIPNCPHCNSKNVYGISRIVGYFSVIDNWNNSKKAEFNQRQKGKYWSEKLKE